MMTTVEYPNDPQARPKCGTYPGVQAHSYYGERLCDACRTAAAAYMRAYRQRGRCGRGLGWPLGPNDPAPRNRAKAIPRWVRMAHFSTANGHGMDGN